MEKPLRAPVKNTYCNRFPKKMSNSLLFRVFVDFGVLLSK
jgi:hypothetical protein